MTHCTAAVVGLGNLQGKKKEVWGPIRDIKDVRAKILQPIDFLKIFYCSQITSYSCHKWKQKMGITDFVSEIKRVENYPDFEKLAHVIQLGLQGFIAVRNVEGESTEASDLSHIL